MDYLSLNSLIHSIEEVSIPIPSPKAVLWAGLLGIPVAVILHDTSDSWFPQSRQIPVLSWFVRKWRRDPETKALHLRVFRNALLFAGIVAVLHSENARSIPLHYVSDRVGSINARNDVTRDIVANRNAAFAAANECLGEEAYDGAKSRQQRDTALRRRHIQESGL